MKASDHAAFLGLKTIEPAVKDHIQIGKDIDRTYSSNPTFGRNDKFREMLRDLLISYSVYDGEVGYVQGMNLIAANLIYHIKLCE